MGICANSPAVLSILQPVPVCRNLAQAHCAFHSQAKGVAQYSTAAAATVCPRIAPAPEHRVVEIPAAHLLAPAIPIDRQAL